MEKLRKYENLLNSNYARSILILEAPGEKVCELRATYFEFEFESVRKRERESISFPLGIPPKTKFIRKIQFWCIDLRKTMARIPSLLWRHNWKKLESERRWAKCEQLTRLHMWQKDKIQHSRRVPMWRHLPSESSIKTRRRHFLLGRKTRTERHGVNLVASLTQ